MARTLMVAGNWKMNKTFVEGLTLASDVVKGIGSNPDISVVLIPPFIHIQPVSAMTQDDRDWCYMGAQNCHYETKGAYTGEISAEMLKTVGVQFVLVGHSERRLHFGETDAILAKKVDAALSQGLRPIFCCGEPLEIRERNEQEQFVQAQLENGLFHLDEESISRVVVAYEPIWAIGTGKTATPDQAQEIHYFIRQLIASRYSSSIADNMTILYGGSCNALNAKELFGKNDVDGGLIGGASLKSDEFIQIVRARAAARPTKKA